MTSLSTVDRAFHQLSLSGHTITGLSTFYIIAINSLSDLNDTEHYSDIL